MKRFAFALAFSLALSCAGGSPISMLPHGAFTVPESELHRVTLADGSISPKYWGAPIRALKPVRVHRDNINVAVVTFSAPHQERGVYFCVTASSYLPVDSLGRKFRWNKAAGHLEYVFTPEA